MRISSGIRSVSRLIQFIVYRSVLDYCHQASHAFCDRCNNPKKPTTLLRCFPELTCHSGFKAMEGTMAAISRPVQYVLAYAAICTASFASAETLEEIVVSRAIESSTQYLPFSFSKINGERLQLRQTLHLEEITETTPGLSISRNSLASKIYMRGVGSQGNAGLDQSVSFYVDGVYHPRSRDTKLALVDVSEIEILKGPQSTYHGLNANAGTIAVHTRNAEVGQTETNVRAVAGTGNYNRFTGIHNYSPSDTFAIRLVADTASSDGIWDMVNPATNEKLDDGGVIDRHAFRISGTWLANENIEVLFKLEFQESDRDNAFAWQPTGCDNLYGMGFSGQQALDSFWTSLGSGEPNRLSVPFTCRAGFLDNRLDEKSPAAPTNKVAQEGTESVLKINWSLGNSTLRMTTAYYENEFGFSGNDVTHGASFHRVLWVADKNRQISQELRLDMPLGENVGWMVGLYAHSADVSFRSGDADARGRQPQFIATDVSQNDETLSLATALHWNLTERFDLEGGIRHIQTRKEYSGVDARYRANGQPNAERASFNAQVSSDISGNPDAYLSYSPEVRARFDDEKETFRQTLPSLTLGYQDVVVISRRKLFHYLSCSRADRRLVDHSDYSMSAVLYTL